MRADERRDDNKSPVKYNEYENGTENSAYYKNDRRVLRVVNKECSGDRSGKFATCEKANDRDCNFLEEQREQCPNQAKNDRNGKQQERGWFINQMRGQLYARQESNSCDAKPEKFSPKEQNENANQRANNGNGGVHRRKGFERLSLKSRLCQTSLYLISVPDTSTTTPSATHAAVAGFLIGLAGFEPAAYRCGDRSTRAYQAHLCLGPSCSIARAIIGLVGFEPTASWSRTRRSTK